MKPTPISVEVITATTPPIDNPSNKGLATLQVTVPLFVWTELLTHRRFSRNASSARAMSTKRYTDMGFYVPDTWYAQGTGMQSGEQISEPSTIENANRCYSEMFVDATFFATNMLESGISKEQANRVIPPIKMVRGIVTGTQHAWLSFLHLRDNKAADTAMQILSKKVRSALLTAQWKEQDQHMPFDDKEASIEDVIARLARVSYDRTSGKDNKALYDMLLREKHFSPFEHIAQWRYNPMLSNYTNDPNDVQFEDDKDYLKWHKRDYSGWESYRAVLTQN